MRKHSALSLMVCLVLAGCVFAGNWPQYLGPDRNAASDETGLLRSWPDGGPKVLWTIEVGPGYGAPAVVGDKAYMLDRVAGKQDVVRCLDINTGKEVWSYSYEAGGRVSHPGSRGVPTIEGNLMYTCGVNGDLYCTDLKTHKPLWNKNIWTDFGGEALPMWAICQHPLICGDLVIVAAQTPEVGVVAFDKVSGQVAWKTPALEGLPGYVAPAPVKVGDETHIVMITATSRRESDGKSAPAGSTPDGKDGVMMGLDPKTGNVLWTYKGWQCRIPIPNVVDCGMGRMFISGGYMAGSAMIQVDKAGNKYEVNELYTTWDFNSHCHPAVLYKGHLYGHCTTNTQRDGMVCMSIDGKQKWKTGTDPVFDKGGFLLVDDLILSVDGRDGFLYLIEPNPEGFKPLGKVDLLDTRECWAPLALSNGKLLIRDQDKMKCVLVK